MPLVVAEGLGVRIETLQGEGTSATVYTAIKGRESTLDRRVAPELLGELLKLEPDPDRPVVLDLRAFEAVAEDAIAPSLGGWLAYRRSLAPLVMLVLARLPVLRLIDRVLREQHLAVFGMVAESDEAWIIRTPEEASKIQVLGDVTETNRETLDIVASRAGGQITAPELAGINLTVQAASNRLAELRAKSLLPKRVRAGRAACFYVHPFVAGSA